MKKVILTALSCILLAGCSNTPKETAVTTTAPSASEAPVDVLEAYRTAWTNSAKEEHHILLDYWGAKELFPFASVEQITDSAQACEGIDQAIIDEDIKVRSEMIDSVYTAVSSFVSESDFAAVEKQTLTDADMLFRLDIKSNENGRYSMAVYNGGYVLIRQVLPASEGWYQVDETVVTDLKNVIDTDFVLTTEEYESQLTCWERIALDGILASLGQ